jgi:FkbM family methyltransferase
VLRQKPVSWNGDVIGPHHHSVFSKFKAWSGQIPAFRQADFVGMMTSREFVSDLLCFPEPISVPELYPAFDEGYFEWIDVLESVVAARGSYTMIDLGAGFGRWAARAVLAARRYDPSLPHRVIAVEAEPRVFEWMHQHFAENHIEPSDHKLIHGAVCEQSSRVLFYIGGPPGGQFDRELNDWYGQFLTQDYDASGESEEDGEYCGHQVLRHKTGWRSIFVPGVSLRNLLNDLEHVDLIDMDIEGQELPTIRSTIEELDVKVKRLHIGTHGKEIESELRELLSSHGWECLADYPLRSINKTPWGEIWFENGVQSWTNPRLRTA